MSKVGRNDPCPCGSGKKYKRCCLGKEEGEAATDIVSVDSEVTMAVLEWVGKEHRERVDHVRPLLPEALWEGEDHVPLITPLLAWETPSPTGEPLCHAFPERRRRNFDPRQEDWFQEQRGSWFSLWDVLEVRRDEGLFLRDLLTGEERFVRERSATHYIVERSVLLARTARLGGVWALESIHPAALPSTTAEGVVAEARRLLKLGSGKVDPLRLRGEAAFRLAALWHAAVQELAHAPRPMIRNTDGDALTFPSDMFLVQPEDHPEVLRRLRALPGLEPDDDDPEVADACRCHEFVWLAETDEDEMGTVRGRIQLTHRSLSVDSNSEERADDALELLEDRLEGLVRYLGREHLEPEDLEDHDDADDEDWNDEDGAAEPEIDPAEAARRMLAFKTKHYATWPDVPLPALDGLTPREAAQDKRRTAYRQLEVLLRELERTESRLPFEQRYDVGILRRELDVP